MGLIKSAVGSSKSCDKDFKLGNNKNPTEKLLLVIV